MLIKRLIISLIFCLAGFSAHAFQLALINGGERFGLVNKTSNDTILRKEFEKIGWANDGLSFNGVIRARKNEKWGLYNENGKAITGHEYTTLIPHDANHFIASKRSSQSILQQFGLIDTKGKTVIPFNFLRLASSGDHFIATEKVNDQLTQSLYDAKGRSLIRETAKRIEPLNDDHYAVQYPEGLYALHDGQGKAITAAEFQAINSLRSSFFLITYFNRLGVVDAQGRVVVPPIHRRIFLSDQEIKAEGYPQWTFFSTDDQPNFFFDKILPLGDSLFAIQTDKHVGVINPKEAYLSYLTDHVLIKTTANLALVQHNDTKRYGLLNARGEQVLNSTYDSLLLFDQFALGKIQRPSGENWFAFSTEGQALNSIGYQDIADTTAYGQVIAKRNDKLGLLSAEGKERTSFEFDSIHAVLPNRLIVQHARGVGLIDDSGNWLITPYNDQLSFHTDHYQFSQGSASGLADLNGKQLTKGYEETFFLPGGYFKRSEKGYQAYFFNDSLVFDNHYDTIYALNSASWYLKRGDKQFFFRYEDQFVTNLSSGLQELGQFQENYIAFKEDDQWGFLDEIGQLRIANRYDSVKNFSEGIALVKLIGKWGAINRNEELVLQPIYDSIGSFYNALTVVKTSKKYGLVDRTGREVLAVKYDLITRHQGWIELEIGGLKGISDIRGRIIKSPQYDAVQPLDPLHFLVRKGSKYGVVNRNGRDVIPLAYEQVKASPLGFLALKKGKLTTYPIL